MTIPRLIPDIAALPRPVFARAESLAAGSWTHPHSHGWVQFTYAVRGVLEVRTRQGSHMAPPQRAIWIPAGLPHEVMTGGPAEQRSLYIDPAALAPLWSAAPARCRVVEVTPLARELVLAFTRLPRDYDERGAHGRLVGVLLDELVALPEAGLSLPLPADARLAALCEAMLDAPGEDHSLPRLAARAGMSDRTLTRLFRAETGLSLRQWRQRARMLAALPELERGRGVTAVALEMGYDSTSAFIAAFRQLMGRTPGEFFSHMPEA
ncbi:AraC family transcriptional regulator [Nitratidesulfovibrio sp. 1201_IL3209]|uniref:AraC family transcriptional regulator n=1 Tax=Nitratidesulfovibrio sp. 1201_IL3209 TaxID=3084053 RepID=UPI002FD98792